MISLRLKQNRNWQIEGKFPWISLFITRKWVFMFRTFFFTYNIFTYFHGDIEICRGLVSGKMINNLLIYFFLFSWFWWDIRMRDGKKRCNELKSSVWLSRSLPLYFLKYDFFRLIISLKNYVCMTASAVRNLLILCYGKNSVFQQLIYKLYVCCCC